MKHTLILLATLLLAPLAMAQTGTDSNPGTVILDPHAVSKQSESSTSNDSGPGPGTEPMAQGPFQPSWESLKNYQCPEWFRDAKFGIFAHWGPQCQPEYGDGWYARNLYLEGGEDYQFHVKKYGHPSKVGFKDVCNDWKADKFDPDRLLSLYKCAGAKYLVALANHHDNFDLWDSKYQPWNSVAVGPKKNLIGVWAKAAKAAGLRFGVSVHAGPAWNWYETTRGADTKGPLAGVIYDGKLTMADGKGQWWEGLDPQELYAQTRGPGAKQAYQDKFFNRTLDLINKYRPDLLYFDDVVLPLRATEAYGLRIAAHLYNTSIARNHGRNEAVMNTKGLDELQQRCLVYDIERGRTDRINPQPWQTDTCIGNWHYDRRIFEKHGYRKAGDVIQLLCDIVSKNGNLLLSVPIRAGGQLDEDEIAILQEIGQWMNINGEAIYATRPWKFFGEGPSTIPADNEKQTGWRAKLSQLWDWRGNPYTAEDIRFTMSKDGTTLYAIALGVPKTEVRLKSLAGVTPKTVTLLGSDVKLDWKQAVDALVIRPVVQWPCKHVVTFKITIKDHLAQRAPPPATPPKDWDEAVGLWISKGPGHTRPVASLPQTHSGVISANRLLGAAQRKQLATVPAQRVLQTIRDLQWKKPGAKFGCFRWYWEESEPIDTNAAFFIGGPLITLDFVYHDQLDAESQVLLSTILKDLKVWFDGQASKLTTIYPNKYMADVVYDWLLTERAGDATGRAKLEKIMLQAAREWRDGHWGWGEHLSDGYCAVLIDELSTLLLLSKTLPDNLHTEYQGLLNELLAIEDAYSNRPRVPTIRCYAFESVPTHVNFRERVRAADGTDPRHVVPPEPGSGRLAAKTAYSSPTLYDLKWHEKMPPRAAPQKDIRIATGGGDEAVCRAEPDMMLGTLTRYPILPGVPNMDRETSGLSWQTMPVAFIRNGTDWGFLRFYAKEGDRERGFPALEKHWTFLSNALSLKEKPVPVGKTWSIQHGGDAVVLRVMPVVPASWDAYEDHLQITRPTGKLAELPAGSSMRGLDLAYPERMFSVRLVPLVDGGQIQRTDLSFSKADPALRWGLRLTGEPMHRLKRIVTLWGLSMNGPIGEAPKIEPIAGAGEGAVRATWTWKARTWKLRLDPAAEKALVEERTFDEGSTK